MFQRSQICPDPNCATKVRKEAAFCPKCGTDLKARQAKFSQNRWYARDDEFAARFSITDLEGFFAKSALEVQSGQQALIFQDGQYQGTVAQGSYSFETFLGVLNRLGRHSKVAGILLRTQEISIKLGLAGLPTRESLTVEAELSIGIKIADPTLFAALMMEKSTYTLLDLRKLLMPQVQQILSEYTRSRGIREMQADGQLRQQLTQQIKQGLQTCLQNQGLALGQIQTLAVGHHKFDEHNQLRGKAWLDVDKIRMEQEIRQQLNTLYTEDEWQKIAKLETEQQIQTKLRDIRFQGDESVFIDRTRRIELLNKIRQADVREAIIEDEAQETLAQLEHEAQNKHLTRQDQALEWAQIRQLAEIKYHTERETAAIEQQRIISLARLQLEQDTETARLQHKIDIARSHENEQQRQQLSALQHDLELQRQQGEAQIAQQKQALQQHADKMIEREREAEFKRVNQWKEAQQQQKLAENDLALTDQTNTVINKNLADKAKILTDLKDAKAERKRKEATQKSAQELEKIAALGKVNQETLIALSDTEQGELIVSLQRTKAMENMNAEQIMALVAENSPHVAEALQQRYRHGNDKAISEQERALFDKLVQQSKTEADRAERQSREAQQNLLAMAGTLANHQATPNVIMAGAGLVTPTQAQPQTPTQEAKILVCHKCGAENELNARYCDKCGEGLG